MVFEQFITHTAAALLSMTHSSQMFSALEYQTTASLSSSLTLILLGDVSAGLEVNPSIPLYTVSYREIH